jgi:AGCS family alanine or glycine:cation symporter
VIIVTGAYKDKTEQPLTISDLEAVAVSGATDDRLIELQAQRVSGGDTHFEVVSGRPVGATFFLHKSVVEDVRIDGPLGNAWTGRIDLSGESGSMTVSDGVDLSVRGLALLTGAPMTAKAFRNGLGGFGNLIVTLAVILFAVSTGISWSYYGDRSVEYLFGAGAVPVYRWVFIFFFFLGAILPLKAVWTFGDVALGLMTLPNLIAVFVLTGTVAGMTRDYLSREHKPYR